MSEDLPLRQGEFFPAEQDTAAGAVDDARPDGWGERVIRFLDKPPRLSTRRMSESTKPGDMSVQPTPLPLRSPCRDSASARTANLLMAYGAPPGTDR